MARNSAGKGGGGVVLRMSVNQVVFLRNLFAEADVTTSNSRRATLAAYCFGCIETDPISRVSLVTQLICRSYPLGVPVWKLW
jgi:hypothetical protein